jgi:hypothetical protein
VGCVDGKQPWGLQVGVGVGVGGCVIGGFNDIVKMERCGEATERIALHVEGSGNIVHGCDAGGARAPLVTAVSGPHKVKRMSAWVEMSEASRASILSTIVRQRQWDRTADTS